MHDVHGHYWWGRFGAELGQDSGGEGGVRLVIGVASKDLKHVAEPWDHGADERDPLLGVVSVVVDMEANSE